MRIVSPERRKALTLTIRLRQDQAEHLQNEVLFGTARTRSEVISVLIDRDQYRREHGLSEHPAR